MSVPLATCEQKHDSRECTHYPGNTIVRGDAAPAESAMHAWCEPGVERIRPDALVKLDSLGRTSHV